MEAAMALRELELDGDAVDCVDDGAEAAQAAERCADECGDFEVEHCRVAADALRRCAESCRGMSTTAWTGPGPGQAAH
jgi:hypothetical protein